MRAIIYGSGDVSEKNVVALLNDFMSVREGEICTAGRGPAIDFTERWGTNTERSITRFDTLSDALVVPAVVILATSEGLPDELAEALSSGMTVLDLCHGLFPLS